MTSYNRLDIYERDGFRCLYCGFDGASFETFPMLEIDHINPDGPDEPANLATCCHACNATKWHDPCESLAQAKEILARHRRVNLANWEKNVLPRIHR
jgi:5-methylcytosine-specific restriction endonuclease McrA